MSSLAHVEMPQPQAKIKVNTSSSLLRVLKYSAMRLISLLVSVIVAVFLTVMIANMGGYVDEIRMGEIRETIVLSVRNF